MRHVALGGGRLVSPFGHLPSPRSGNVRTAARGTIECCEKAVIAKGRFQAVEPTYPWAFSCSSCGAMPPRVGVRGITKNTPAD